MGKERWSNSQEGHRPTDGGRKGHKDTTRKKQRGRKKQTAQQKKGKTEGPGEENEDRQQERLEEKDSGEGKVSLGRTTSAWGGEGRSAQDATQSRSWMCGAEAQGQWSAVRSQGQTKRLGGRMESGRQAEGRWACRWACRPDAGQMQARGRRAVGSGRGGAADEGGVGLEGGRGQGLGGEGSVTVGDRVTAGSRAGVGQGQMER